MAKEGAELKAGPVSGTGHLFGNSTYFNLADGVAPVFWHRRAWQNRYTTAPLACRLTKNL